MNEEHYLAKIERNFNVVDKAPEGVKEKCINDIKWARELSQRIDQLDYDQRDLAIEQMIKVLDDDYVAMGFELAETSGRTM
jgi:hypothetical protein